MHREDEEAGAREDIRGLKDLTDALVSMLMSLSPPERAVFLLRRGFGLDCSDAALAVSASEGECRAMEHRAALQLRHSCDLLLGRTPG